MPLYNYKCSSCGITSEMLLKMSDPAPTLCPECGEDSPNNMSKQISQASFVLKGSGWYETDFKNPKKKSGSKDKGKEVASTSEPSASSKDSSTDTKS